MSTAGEVREQAARVERDPSVPQQRAGNYRMGHVRVHGLPITIENPKGSFRRGVDRDGKPWKCRLPATYGYIKRTVGADGDQVDTYLGPHHKSPLVYVIDQRDADTGDFDEHKVCLGFAHAKHAKNVYLAAFSDGRGKDRLGPMTELTVAQFKQWLGDGNTRKPLHRASGGRVGDDTGMNLPESRATLLAQQQQLLTGERAVQMFPAGTAELPLVDGMGRVETPRGVFHYDPEQITAAEIWRASRKGRENELLDLGRFSKDEIMQRIGDGETPLSVVERDPRGTEVRAAAGTDGTVEDQFDDMDENKGPGHHVGVEDVQGTLMRRRASGGRVAMADGGVPDQADYDPASGIRIRPIVDQPKFDEPEQSGLSRVISRLTGTQFGEPRAQLWPERMIRSGATIAGDVLTGETPVMQPGLRREDFTDQPKPGGWEVAAQPNDPMMERAQDLAGMAMGSSLGATSGTATLGAGPIRRTAALPMDEASRMARASEQGYTVDAYKGGQPHDWDTMPVKDWRGNVIEGANRVPRELTMINSPGNPYAGFFSHDPSVAGRFAAPFEHGAIWPTKLKFEKPLVIDAKGQPAAAFQFDTIAQRHGTTEEMSAFRRAFTEGDYDGVILKNTKDEGDVYVPRNPEQVRSRFARFDPKNVGKSGLLLSDSGAPGAPLAALEHAQPFYSAVERAVEGIAQPKMTGDQWLGTLSNRAGVKPEEMQWTGLGDFLAGKKGQPVTKQEIAQHLAENKVQLQEVTKGVTPWDKLSGRERDKWAGKFEEYEPGAHTPERPDWSAVQRHYEDYMSTGEGAGDPRYAGYQLPGAENYREMLLTLPTRERELAIAENSRLVSRREAIQDRFDELSGNDRPEVLQERRQLTNEFDAITKAIRDGEREYFSGKNEYKSSHWDEPNVLAHMRMNDRDIGGKRSLHLEEIQSDWGQALRAGKDVPPMPMSKTWHELALKRALREAAEKGYDRLSWTPGEAQAARYDLAKQVEAVRANKNPDGTYQIGVKPHGRNMVPHDTAVPADKLASVVGKELAQKIIDEVKEPGVDSGKVFSGLDLKVGGDGMKGFYDQIIPKALEKIGKEHGVKVQRGTADARRRDAMGRVSSQGSKDEPVWYIDIPQSMKDQAMRKGFSMFNEAGALGAPAAGAEDRRRERARGGRLPHMAGGGALMSDADVGLTGKPASGGAALSDADVGLGPVTPDNGALAAAGRGAYQGLTFNFGDELRALGEAGGVKPDEWNNPVAAARGAVRYWGGDKEAERVYDEAAKRERAADEAAAEQHPWAYHGAEAAGSIPGMFALPGGGAAATTAKIGERMIRGGILGAEYGGISGLGRGKGNAIDNAVSTAEGIVGGVLGGAAGPVVGKAVEAGYDKFGRPIVGAMRGWANPEGEAARRLYQAIDKDAVDIAAGKATGMTVQQWAAAKAAGEPVTLADLGSARTQSLLRSAANTSPEARGMLEKALNDRFEQQTERVAGDVRKLVSGGANAGKTADQLVAEYDVARKPAYAAAFNHPKAQGMWDPDLQQMAQAPVVKNAIQMATINAKNEAAKLGLPPPQVPFRFAPDGQVSMVGNMTPNLQFWDVVKKNLDGMGREGQQWSKVLREHLDQQVPLYGKARGVASQFFGERDALEAGRSLAGKKVDPQVIEKVMRQMNPAERDLFREGYASDWAGRVIKNVGDSRDITKAMFNSPNERARAQAVFGPAGMAKIQARMTLETIMDGARKAMGNSTTARQLIEAGLAGGALSGYESGWDPTKMALGFGMGAGARAGLSHRLGAEMASGAKNLIGKVDSRTAAHVAELLTSNDPTKLAKGLQMAVGNKKIADGLRRIADRIGGAGAMQGSVPATRLVVPVGQHYLASGSSPAAAEGQQQ